MRKKKFGDRFKDGGVGERGDFSMPKEKQIKERVD